LMTWFKNKRLQHLVRLKCRTSGNVFSTAQSLFQAARELLRRGHHGTEVQRSYYRENRWNQRTVWFHHVGQCRIFGLFHCAKRSAIQCWSIYTSLWNNYIV
jgi:hypothetical protein